MAVNCLTGFLLLGISKPNEALEFIMIAERIIYKLIDLNSKTGPRKNVHGNMFQDQNAVNSLEVIGENGIEEQLISHRITDRTTNNSGYRMEAKGTFGARRTSN